MGKFMQKSAPGGVPGAIRRNGIYLALWIFCRGRNILHNPDFVG